ncbi:hypothetical protein IJ596_04280 [bacterium]|nr:hypothetical protein [bacterium]
MSNISSLNAVPVFTGNSQKKAKDHSGLKVGLAHTAAATVIGAAQIPFSKKFINRFAKVMRETGASKFEIAKQKSLIKEMSAVSAKTFAKIAPLALACGLIVDYYNNKQRKNTEPNAVTENGNEYVKVNKGKKVGTLLGVAATILNTPRALKKLKGYNPVASAAGAIVAMAVTALGGCMLGAISDNMSNKKAAKMADAAAEAANKEQ